jgi:hypothetical protein
MSRKSRASAWFAASLWAGLLAMVLGQRTAAAQVLIEGEVGLPLSPIEEPPVSFPGFLDRIKNPIADLRPYDPRPECFVSLEGGPGGAAITQAPSKPVVWELIGEGFSIPVLPVVKGTRVDLKNTGRATHLLYSPDVPELLAKDPIGPGGTRQLVLPSTDGAIRVKSQDSPHVLGKIVVLPTRLHSRVAADGTFQIADVPPGKWTLRLWCRDGWLPTTQVLDVTSKIAKLKLTLPERLVTKNPNRGMETP